MVGSVLGEPKSKLQKTYHNIVETERGGGLEIGESSWVLESKVR